MAPDVRRIWPIPKHRRRSLLQWHGSTLTTCVLSACQVIEELCSTASPRAFACSKRDF